MPGLTREHGLSIPARGGEALGPRSSGCTENQAGLRRIQQETENKIFSCALKPRNEIKKKKPARRAGSALLHVETMYPRGTGRTKISTWGPFGSEEF